MNVADVLAVRRKVCSCIVAVAGPDTVGHYPKGLKEAYGRAYRVVFLTADEARVVRCPHAAARPHISTNEEPMSPPPARLALTDGGTGDAPRRWPRDPRRKDRRASTPGRHQRQGAEPLMAKVPRWAWSSEPASPTEKILHALRLRVDDLDAPPQQKGVPFAGHREEDTLVAATTSVFRRASPGRHPWDDIRKYDARVGELQAQRAVIADDLARLRERLLTAPGEDSEALAEWQLNGQDGPRPEPRVPVLEQDIKRCEEDIAGLGRAIDRVAADKAEYVESNRVRLVHEADAQVQDAHARLSALIDQIAEVRRDLAEHRKAAVWASVFPDASAGHQFQAQMVAGGLRRPVESTLGTSTAVQHEQVLQALRADAAWLKEAATNEQMQAMRTGSSQPGASAVWGDTPEGREAERQEREAAKARYVELWGREPA